MLGLLSYVPGLEQIFHTRPLSGWEWLLLMIWPPLIFGAEERKALVRRRAHGAARD